jgi:anthranilate 1,2-dioxygenase ferredoxin reductase subunit
MSNDAYVIVGAGHAGRRAVESLRKQAPDARIVLIGDEPDHPYDRPVLSKDALMTAEGEKQAFIKTREWYRAQSIDLRLGVRVAAIDRAAQRLVLSDDTTLAYHRLLLATGSRVRRFGGALDTAVPVHYVRTIADTRRLRAELTSGKRVGVIGGGFIGLEVASSARTLGCQVTLIEPAPRLLQRSMPALVSKAIQALHQDRGVDLRLSASASRLHMLANGTIGIDLDSAAGDDTGTLSVDIVVVGIGVLPNVELAAEAGLTVANGIVVDECCRTIDAAIFAAGEVTQHFNPVLGKSLRIESWQVAENQPAVAVTNMLGGNAVYGEVPWLWSDQYDTNIQTLGIFEADDVIVVRGEASDAAFSVLSIDPEGRLKAAATVNAGRDMAAFRRLMQKGVCVPSKHWADTAVSLRDLLK